MGSPLKMATGNQVTSILIQSINLISTNSSPNGSSNRKCLQREHTIQPCLSVQDQVRAKSPSMPLEGRRMAAVK